MKKLVLVAMAFLVTGVIFSQAFNGGRVVAVSSYELILKENVTFNDFITFTSQKYIPEIEKAMPGIKIYMMIGDRGENKFRYGEMIVFDDLATRNKYYPVEDDTATSPAIKAILPQMNALSEENSKYVLNMRRIYTDWLTDQSFTGSFKKGMVVALGSYDLVLKDNVTFKQYFDFTGQKLNPAIEKAMPGMKIVNLWGDRGASKFHMGEMWIFDNVDVRNKYFPSESDTENSPALQSALDQIKAITDESGNYILNSDRVYTDWIIR